MSSAVQEYWKKNLQKQVGIKTTKNISFDIYLKITIFTTWITVLNISIILSLQW